VRVVDDLPGIQWLRPLGDSRSTVASSPRPGELFLAERRGGPAEVAVRVFPASMLGSARQRVRLEGEIEALSLLVDDPYVVRLYDAGVSLAGRPFLVMEFCPDGSLADHLARVGPLKPREVRGIGMKLSGALATAHSHGIIHRNLKPTNILIKTTGEPALTDFGLLSLRAPEGDFSPDPETVNPYAAPEAFLPELMDAATDVFSLAAVLFGLLSGGPPGASDPLRVVAGDDLPDLPRVPWSLMQVLREAMAIDPLNRYASAEDLRAALQSAI
jgi:serine/threonine protein kinase